MEEAFDISFRLQRGARYGPRRILSWATCISVDLRISIDVGVENYLIVLRWYRLVTRFTIFRNLD